MFVPERSGRGRGDHNAHEQPARLPTLGRWSTVTTTVAAAVLATGMLAGLGAFHNPSRDEARLVGLATGTGDCEPVDGVEIGGGRPPPAGAGSAGRSQPGYSHPRPAWGLVVGASRNPYSPTRRRSLSSPCGRPVRLTGRPRAPRGAMVGGTKAPASLAIGPTRAASR